jgi:CRISPR system Cascade subunit CasA
VLTLGQTAQRRARVVDHALTHRQSQLGRGLRLWAFGYEMRKDNPICWHDATLPLYDLAACDRDQQALVQSEVARWLAAAELAAMYLRGAVKDAWFSADARGEFSHVDATFWSATEPAFYRQLQTLIDAARAGTEPPPLPARETWHHLLARTALRLFDDTFVGTGAVERQNPRRAALAHKQLRNSLYGPKLKGALGLPVDAATPKTNRKSASRAKKEPA